MTKDGYARMVIDKGARLVAKAASSDKSRLDVDHVQVSVQPAVDVDGRIVYMRSGQWMWAYGIREVARRYAVTYLPGKSKPMPIADAWDKGMMAAALQAYLQASGKTTSGAFRIDYAARLDARGQPDAELNDMERAQIRALMRLDPMRQGYVTATHAQVMMEMAKEAGAV